MKNKAIKIAKSFLRPPGSFGQTQRFIAESDIPKMVNQIYDRPIGANKDKIIEILKEIKLTGIEKAAVRITSLYFGSVSKEKMNIWHDFLSGKGEIAKDIAVFITEQFFHYNHQSHPTPEISKERINELWKKHKGEFLVIFNRTDFETFIKELNNE